MTEARQKKGYISRRDFLKITTLVAAGTGLAACTPNRTSNEEISSTAAAPVDQYPQIPYAPPEPVPYVLTVFTALEAEEVEALTARIYPGNPSDPGRARPA